MNFGNREARGRFGADHSSKISPKPVRQSRAAPASSTHVPYGSSAQWTQSTAILPTSQSSNTSAIPLFPHDASRQQIHTGFTHSSNHSVVRFHNWASTADLPAQTTPAVAATGDDYAAVSTDEYVREVVGERLSEIIASIDEESYTESVDTLIISVPGPTTTTSSPPPAYTRSRALTADQGRGYHKYEPQYRPPDRVVPQPQARTVNVLSKLSYYRNSRLPTELPPFRAYISTYPLLCLAALCSANAYNYRQNAVKDEQLISANARIGTKAMVVKSVTCADEKTLVFAIRGTSVLSLRDWNVNLDTRPESPTGFLDDEGNYCHAGFLRVAKAMVKPIAARLRHLLEENPHRLSYSLLITGHSAGGAVASLLYAHMLSVSVRSELTILCDCFKRVHCVTFGAPPISLLPLKKPPGKERQLQKCMFHSFINEGDPVVRAEKAYVLSLVDLLTTTPSSGSSLLSSINSPSDAHTKPSKLTGVPMSMLKITNLGLFTGPKRHKPRHGNLPLLPPRNPLNATPVGPVWSVPPGTLSNAGRLVVLRGPAPPPKPSASQVDLTKEFEEVRACTVTDEQIRQVIFGDPLMHAMDVYRRRIEALAMKAVTGREKYY